MFIGCYFKVFVLKMFRSLDTLFSFFIAIHISVCFQIKERDVDTNLVKSDSEVCVCVPYYLCGPDNYVIETGEGLINPRFGGVTKQPIRKGNCTGDIEICCRLRGDNTIVTATFSTDVTPKVQKSKCGHRNFGGVILKLDDKILPAGGQTNFGEFPWMVALFSHRNGEDSFECGASVIRQNVVMTAAHCVNKMKVTEIKIHAGDWDIQSPAESLEHQERFVSRVIIHPNFHNGNLQNDIALLVLTSPLEFTDNVAPICLPENNIKVQSKECIATGWGKSGFGNEFQNQNILKTTDLPLVEHAECQSKLRTTRLGRYFRLHESFICAGGEANVDTCKGDGGGPLVCSIHGTNPPVYIQMGITSWGIGCGNTIPGVYTDVFTELPWLTTQLENIAS